MQVQRWCPRCRTMQPWLKARMGRAVKLCAGCGAVTAKGKPKAPKRQGPDAKWSKAVRVRDGHRCRRCGGPASDGAHVIRRAYLKTRHDPRNGLALCRECHRWFGAHPLEWQAWLKENMPELYREMAEQAGAPIL